ncbi:carboxylase [Sphaerisporangium rufum]|uniref:Carboxylase n=1 Tax=Sphaerisporangium rufum TaxID=1381558 RepID=A0A919V490_9ACTN|nr:ATP-grasp domain-containing protein [Sphaerisporangium rufum]GII77025.1 carboxylase [Sphaerisporangium rufum]
MHMLLVGAWPELANQLVGLPARVSLLQQPKSVDGREQEWAHRYVEVEYGEVDAAVAVAERIHHQDPVDVVVGFREFALPAVAAIARALDLPSVPGPVDTLGLDKAEVRDLIRDGAARVVRHRVCRTEQDVHGFAAEAGFPLILKPAGGAGSIGVHAVRDAAGLADAWRHASAAAAGAAVLAEELVTGPEYSVETRSAGGRHEVVAVTEKLTTGAPHFVEVGHLVPARLPARVAETLGAEALRAVAATGHRTGPCHVELILTGEGPAIVEINRRPGGDRIWELVRLATGRDIMAESLWDAAGAEPPIGTRSAAAAIRFLTPTGPATVAEVLPRDAAIGVPGFLRGVISVPGPGAEVEPASSSLGRFGYVLVAGADAESAAAAAEQARARVDEELFVPRP